VGRSLRYLGQVKSLSLQAKRALVEDNGTLALVAIIHLPHLGEVVEPADDVRRAERFASLDLLSVQLLDKSDVYL
jgi:hypothetical protein